MQWQSRHQGHIQVEANPGEGRTNDVKSPLIPSRVVVVVVVFIPYESRTCACACVWLSQLQNPVHQGPKEDAGCVMSVAMRLGVSSTGPKSLRAPLWLEGGVL